MPMLSKLDVINECIATQGEAPLNSIDSDHPYVPPALQSIELATTLELGKGWYFNEDEFELQPEPDGTIFLPRDTITAITLDPRITGIVQRGRRLYNRFKGTYTIGRPVWIRRTVEIPFDDLPMLWNQLVAARAVLDFQQKYDADGQQYEKLIVKYNQTAAIAKIEDIRQRKENVLYNPRSTFPGKLARVRPMKRYARRYDPFGGY